MSKRPVDDIFPEAEREDSINTLRCVKPPFGCGKFIVGFRDELSAREYQISGMCQDCQDSLFGDDADLNSWEEETY